MNRALLLECLFPLDHLVVLNNLELQVDTLNHHLILFSVNFQDLSLSLLVATGYHFNLFIKVWLDKVTIVKFSLLT